VNGFICPSQQHDLLQVSLQPDSVHSHPRSAPGETGYEGSISDYRAVRGSTCQVHHTDLASAASPLPGNHGYASADSHLVDGPMPQCKRANVISTTTPNTKGVKSFRPQTGLKNITDGTSKTLMAGEVGRGTSELGQAFNGNDRTTAVEVGELNGFCQRCGHPPVPPGTTVTGSDLQSYGDDGFGSVHNGVTLFVMCDGSVQALSNDINLPVLDRMATRAGDDPYDVNGAATPCLH